MMTPPELLEQALAAHGDLLYHLALLAAGDERGAESLLRAVTNDLVAAWRETPTAAAPAAPGLLARLAAAARRSAAQPPGQRTRARRRVRPGVLPLALQHLSLDQRLALALHLLSGYDVARIGQVLELPASAARNALIAAVRALGPFAGSSLPDRTSGELCLEVHDALADPVAGARHGSLVRGHLAACALCRSFDQAWDTIIQRVEATLRNELRERPLPPELRARLLAVARPPRRFSPGLRLALPPLAVLALIAALVLPGFLRQPVSVVERELAAPLDPDALVARALARQTSPPDRGGVWYGRYATLWYFDDSTIAPLQAELWLDPRNPARHRLQLTHADGGAPYELQLGNGSSRLYYALDALYAPTVYGRLRTPAQPGAPALLVQELDRAGQERARNERLSSGPWAIPLAYLEQARQAPDLRVLGRQRDGARSVQILSFSGLSPLGLPPDAPGATAERVTVLLALDLEDGLLRTATELAGPSGTTQTSRVTWRLLEEQTLATAEQIERAFSIGRAWTGIGDFSEVGRYLSADQAVPLIAEYAVVDPGQLLGSRDAAFWMPAAPPPGAERALLLWSDGTGRGRNPQQALIYLGEGRRLMLLFNVTDELDGELLTVGPWQATLHAGRTRRYTLALSRTLGTAASDGGAPGLLIDAWGFSRNELLRLVASLRPFDSQALAAHGTLFTPEPAQNPEAFVPRRAAAGHVQRPPPVVGFGAATPPR